MAVPTAPANLQPLVRGQGPVRAWSWIVTIYGDVVLPRGGELALASLTQMCGSLGIEPGLVRTALTRLVADGLIERRRIGKSSFYRLTPAVAGDFARAAQRIYFAAPPRWGSRWRFAVLPAALRTEDGDPRSILRDAGYGQLAPNVLIAPLTADGHPASGRRPEARGVIFLDAAGNPAEAAALAEGAWQLEPIAAAYRTFLDRFAPLAGADRDGFDPETALAVRIALIHAYRRIILKDPLLPPELLPAGWPGHAARKACAAVYRLVRPASERWLDRHALGPDGPLPHPDQALHLRFAAD